MSGWGTEPAGSTVGTLERDEAIGLDLYIAYEGDSFPAEQLADILAGLGAVVASVAEAGLDLVSIETGRSITVRLVGMLGSAMALGAGVVVGLPVLAVVGGVTGAILTLAQADEAGANAERARAEARAIEAKTGHEIEAIDADAAAKRADAALKRAQAQALAQKDALADEDIDVDEIVRRLAEDPTLLEKARRAARAIASPNVRRVEIGQAVLFDQDAA